MGNVGHERRRAAFADTVVRDILYALRACRRAPLATLTIVATVALGLGLVAVVFTFYNAFFLRADAVRNPEELFEVRRPPSPGARAWMPFTPPKYELLRSETTVFADTFAMVPAIATRIEGRTASGTMVTGNFFQVLGVNAELGRTLTPADDERSAGQPLVVLSERGWSKLFASDRAVVGRSVVINGFRYDIAGVMPSGFRGLAVAAPDYWAPLSLFGQFRPASAGKEDDVAIVVVGRLRPGLSAEAATARLTAWAFAQPEMTTGNPRWPATIRLEPRQGTVSVDVLKGLKVFAPLFFVFGLILMIGCANVANLLLARGISRQREIGIRLSLGASRGRIIRLLLTESLLLALVSATCAFALSRLMLEAAVYVTVTTMPPEVAEYGFSAPAADWRMIVFLLAGAIASTVLFGLAPALQTTRLELVRTMRGELTRYSRPSLARNAFIALQVAASALLLISAAVFLRGAFAAAAADPGLRTSDTVILQVANEPLRAAMLDAVRTDASVEAVAASSPPPLAFGKVAEARSESSSAPVDYKFVSPEYFNLLDIDVLKGRAFAQAERSAETGVAVVSESTARRLWPNADAVGQTVRIDARRQGTRGDPQVPFGTFTVVGVVRDVTFGQGSFQAADSGMYLPAGFESQGTWLTLRVHGDPDQARLRLIERLTKIDPAMGDIKTLRMITGRPAYLLRMATTVMVVLGGLALLLTLSGLFGVLSYIVEQRRKEIGVRMALGATARNVVRLVLFQSVGPIGAGLIAGGALAAGLATVLMSTSAASEISSVIRVLDPVAYSAGLLGIVAACTLAASIPARRAARIDPMTTLKQE